MIRQIGLLLKLKFINFLGINEAIRSGKKKTAVMTTFLMAFLGVFICGYVGWFSYYIAYAGLGFFVPLLLTIVTSLIIFFFTVLKSGAEIFDYGYYCSVAHLPVKKSAVISARLIGMYLTDATISFLVFLSGTIGVSVFASQSITYYLIILLSAFLVPVLPLCVSAFIGVGVSAIASRFKKAKFVGSVLACLVLSALCVSTYFIPNDAASNETIESISQVLQSVSAIYPPAYWVSQAVLGLNYLNFVLFAIGSILVATIFIVVVSKIYTRLCLALGSTSTGNGKVDVKQIKQRSVFLSLYKREFKRLFSSSVYFTNTLAGNLICIIGCVAIIFANVDTVGLSTIPQLPMVLVGALAVFCNIAPTTSASIGIEGKSFEITKSLPIKAKTIYNAKLGLSLTFSIATAIIVSVILVFAPMTSSAPIWMIVISPIVFSFALPVTGLLFNAKFPCLKWVNEQVPVKQGKAVAFTMLVAFALGLSFIALGCLLGEIAVAIYLFAVVVYTVIAYKHLCSIRLCDIN